MIVHPAYPGGKVCAAVTSQIDITPTLLALSGVDPVALAKTSGDLKGRSFAGLLRAPEKATPDSLRPASLFNYNMLSFQDARWARKMELYMRDSKTSLTEKLKELIKVEPVFHDRCAIRSAFDGRYRFSRYFSSLDFNTPTTYEALIAKNDLELYDLQEDSEEVNNLATNPKANGDLIMAMNAKLNGRIAEEVGDDNGHFIPIRNGKWFFPPKSERQPAWRGRNSSSRLFGSFMRYRASRRQAS
jgi:arylsulfatase A-like enzyme